MLIDETNGNSCELSGQCDRSSSNPTDIDPILMNISAFSLKGKRSHMEDFFDIGYQMKPKEQRMPNEWPYEYFYFGIFDGHGGSDAAQFAKQNLLKFITDQPGFWSDNDDEVLRAIQIGYAETHVAMRKVMHGWPRTHRFLPSTAGTTASVLFIRNGKYYSGHVGDSRIVISRKDNDSNQWIAQQLTEDHKPESESEMTRIRRAGGDVKPKVGVHRVVWRRPVLNPVFTDEPPNRRLIQSEDIIGYPVPESCITSYQIIPFLAIARSLGDFWSINPYSGQYTVSPEPDVSCQPIDPNDQCILLATDGLWSVINSQQAIRALEEFKAVSNDERCNETYAKQYFTTDNFYNVLKTHEKDCYALSLVYLAYQVWERRSLRSDNITSVVVMLGDILSHQKSTSKRTYRTRLSSQLHSPIPSSFRSCTDRVQICMTRMFKGCIRLRQEPSLSPETLLTEQLDDLERLGNWLMLPPSAVPKICNIQLIPPSNYKRLNEAEVRKVYHPLGWGNILVKQVSDDPSDRELRPERSGKKPGLKVRDASTQCTQSIYDFALAWLNEGEEDVEDDDNDDMEGYTEISEDCLIAIPRNGETMHDDDDDSCIVYWEEDSDDQNRGDLDCLGEESINDVNEKADSIYNSIELGVWPMEKESKVADRPNTRRRSKELSHKSAKEHMLQPRSDNCKEQTIFRRQTRSGASLSLTGGDKRKVIPGSPENKRRRSHPLSCAVAQS